MAAKKKTPKAPLTPEEEAAKAERAKKMREKTNKNLIPFNKMSKEEAFALQSKGGRKAGERWAKRKQVREMMEDIFYSPSKNDKNYGEMLVMSVIVKGIKSGDPKVLEIFRDTIDGKLTENVQIDGNPIAFYFDKNEDKPSE